MEWNGIEWVNEWTDDMKDVFMYLNVVISLIRFLSLYLWNSINYFYQNENKNQTKITQFEWVFPYEIRICVYKIIFSAKYSNARATNREMIKKNVLDDLLINTPKTAYFFLIQIFQNFIFLMESFAISIS